MSGIVMRKSKLKNLTIDCSLISSITVSTYLTDEDIDIIVKELEDFYQCRIEEIPVYAVHDAIREYLYDNFSSDIYSDLRDNGDLMIDIWNNEQS